MFVWVCSVKHTDDILAWIKKDSPEDLWVYTYSKGR